MKLNKSLRGGLGTLLVGGVDSPVEAENNETNAMFRLGGINCHRGKRLLEFRGKENRRKRNEVVPEGERSAEGHSPSSDKSVSQESTSSKTRRDNK